MFSAQRSVSAQIFQISARLRPHERTPTMPSRTDDAKRALVKLLRSLGEDFGCRVTATSDSPGHDVHRAVRAVARKVHPDKPPSLLGPARPEPKRCVRNGGRVGGVEEKKGMGHVHHYVLCLGLRGVEESLPSQIWRETIYNRLMN